MTSIPATVQERIPMPLAPVVRPEVAAAVSFGDVLRILKQRVFLILFVWFFTVAATVGLTLYLVKEWPLYRANSAVFVESPYPETPLQLERPLIQVELMDRYVADQAVRVKDEGFLREVVESAVIQETSWFQNQPGEVKMDKMDDAHEELVDDLLVKAIPSTSYLRVSFRTKNRQDAPVIVDTIIDRYLSKMATESKGQYQGQLDKYGKAESTLQGELTRIREEKQSMIRSEIGVPGVIEGLNVVGDTWRSYAVKATDLETDKMLYKAQWENLLGVDPSQIAIDPQTQLMIEQDPQVTYFRQRLSDLKLGREILLQQGMGEGHRQVENLSSEAVIVEQQLLDTLAEKEEQVRSYQINQAETMYLNAMQAETQLRERVLDAEDKQRDLDGKLAKYRILEEDQLLKEDQLSRIRDFASQLQMIIDAQGAVRVRRVGTQTLVPKTRDFPRWEYNLPAGVFLGLLLAVGLAMLLEFVDTSIKTSRDIVRHLHIPILGTVPDLDDDEADLEEIELATHVAPRSLTAEAFRGIRTNLLLSSPAEQQRTVLVTSAKPEEGKTAVAVNLAVSLAQGGRRVLLVDANFHRPRLHTLFANANRQGLSNVLVGQVRVEEVVSPTDLPNLDVLTAGPIPPNPAELLAASYLREMVAQAVERYDQIIFDGPPVLLVSDVLVMTNSVNGLVLVCRAKTSLRGTVQRAREQIERINGHVFGAVLNGARVARGGYFREQIRAYYDYQPEDQLGEAREPALPAGGKVDELSDEPSDDSSKA